MSARVTVARWILPSRKCRSTCASGRGRTVPAKTEDEAKLPRGQRPRRVRSRQLGKIGDPKHCLGSVRQRFQPNGRKRIARVVDKSLEKNSVEFGCDSLH